MSSAQVGKTEILNNGVGYFVDFDPSPILVLQPTLEMGEAWSKDRLSTMIRDTPALRDKVAGSKSRDSGNTILHKTFPGGHVTIAGANSPSSLASRPIRVVFCDEVDRYPASIGNAENQEGDPVSLAVKRTATFWNRKVLLTSTPTVKGFSRIEQSFLESDQRYFFVPCPHCAHPHRLVWANVVWPKDEPELAVFKCPAPTCGKPFSNTAKNAAIAKCRPGNDGLAPMGTDGKRLGWRATAPFKGHAGFHLSELYSPWRRLDEVVRDFLEAKAHPERFRVWINTSLGETWDEGGFSLDEHEMMKRREKYSHEIPSRVLMLTIGADTQTDRIECELIGWGGGEESWNIDYRIFHGDPDIPEGEPGSPWTAFTEYCTSARKHESGVEMSVTTVCIDSGGDKTQSVYKYVKSRRGRSVFAIKGQPGEDIPIVGSPNRKKFGKKVARPVDVYMIGVHQAKQVIYGRLKQTEQGAGFCHFPMVRDVEYFRQLTAEKIVTKYTKGFPRREFKKDDSRRNEALDCRVYGYAAMMLAQPDWSKLAFRLKKRIEELAPLVAEPVETIEDGDEEIPPDHMPAAQPQPPPPPKPVADEEKPEPKRPKLRRRHRGGYVGRW